MSEYQGQIQGMDCLAIGNDNQGLIQAINGIIRGNRAHYRQGYNTRVDSFVLEFYGSYRKNKEIKVPCVEYMNSYE